MVLFYKSSIVIFRFGSKKNVRYVSYIDCTIYIDYTAWQHKLLMLRTMEAKTTNVEQERERERKCYCETTW